MALVRWTVEFTALKWNCSESLVYKLIRQGRVKVEEFGKMKMVVDDVKPGRAALGELTPEQRLAWPQPQPGESLGAFKSRVKAGKAPKKRAARKTAAAAGAAPKLAVAK